MRIRTIALLLIAAALTSHCRIASAADQRGTTPADYFAYTFVSDPHLSPDATQAAYVVTTIDQKKNARASSIWLVAVDGSTPPRRITEEGVNSTSPRWSPDGRTLAFLSARSADTAAPATAEAPRPQIYLLPMTTGGEALPLTTLKNGATSIQWSPDGSHLLCLSRTGPSDAVAPADRKSDVRHYTHISYKFNDTGWFDDKRSHVWVVDVKTAQAKQLTDGQNWNDTDPQWSPDGTHIAFVSDRTGHAFDDSHNTDVWTIAADGGPLTKISDHAFEDEAPRWSPDGKQILFLGQTARRQFPKLYLNNAAGGAASSLAVDSLDVIPSELALLPGGQALFIAEMHATTQLFRADLASRKLTQVTTGDRAIHSYDANAKAGVMVYLANDFEHPDDLYISALDGSGQRQLTHANQQLWQSLKVGSVERLNYKSTDGLPMEGFLVKPLGFDPAKKYPLILTVHGGPAGQYTVGWNQEFQVYAARGYAVFFCNPRGSTGYGEKFERGIVNNWGGMDYTDIMAGLDAAIAHNAWIDTGKLGVTGGSYGGYMTNWIVGHTTRFKAAVTLRSVSNFISDDGTRDGAYGHEDDFKGPLFDNFDQYWNASPLKYARNVKTPTLVLHSDMDFRVPIEQGEQWFRALQHYGVPSELVLFPRENHNLTRTGEPKHIVESMNWQAYWFSRYLDDDTAAKAPDAQ